MCVYKSQMTLMTLERAEKTMAQDFFCPKLIHSTESPPNRPTAHFAYALSRFRWHSFIRSLYILLLIYFIIHDGHVTVKQKFVSLRPKTNMY